MMLYIKRILSALLLLSLALTFIGCNTVEEIKNTDSNENEGSTSSELGSVDEVNKENAKNYGEGKNKCPENETGVMVSSGNNSIYPSSCFGFYEEYTENENGEGSALNACGAGVGLLFYGDYDIDSVPSLVLDGNVSVQLPVNGSITSVDIVRYTSDNYTSERTTLEALSTLPAGKYLISVTVLLQGTCDPNKQYKKCYDDVFWLVVEC